MLLPFDDRVNDFLKKTMEDVAFRDWPGQPVDLNSGTNSWLPAYGFQTPTSLLEKEDFIGNPDAEYFLHCASSGNYMYLETILEETSDDLRSESDVDSRGSPVGWLATDSESGSVICIDQPDAEADCESDRELACPAKRRKQDFFLTLPNEDNELTSLSRSSSLLQFESLEKQCQEVCASSPSIYSQFSFDSLETNNRKNNISPDSLNSPKSDSTEDESDYYRSLKIDIPGRKQKSNDSLLYNATRCSGSESSDSDVTLEASRSFDNLRTWRSYDSLLVNGNKGKDKVSVENLSEDSGYGDNLTSKGRDDRSGIMKSFPEKKNSYVGFPAYDGDVYQEHISGNFGVSYQDLTALKEERLDVPKMSHLIERFVRSKRQQQQQHRKEYDADVSAAAGLRTLNLDDSNFKTSSCSEPDLLKRSDDSVRDKTQVCISSVPKDLNFIGKFNESACDSVAVKNWNLEDLLREENENVINELVEINEEEEVDFESDLEDSDMAHYKREGSYAEAMSNRVDLSDDEHSLINRNKPKLPRTTIVEFDRKVLKAISEQSLQSLRNSTANLQAAPQSFSEQPVTSTPISSLEKRNIASTPNLAAGNQFEPVCMRYRDEDRRKSVENIRRKSSIIKSSTSTSGISDNDDKTLEESIKSFGSSKGVHFSPVVSEVNWRDSSISTVTPDRESIYSLRSSSPDTERRHSPSKEILRPRARLGTPVGLSHSQPELNDEEDYKKEFVESLKNLRQDFSKSQPDVTRFQRRGSQLIKKDKDGSVIKAYVDRDGIQYKHTHLDITTAMGHHQNQHHQQQQNQQQQQQYQQQQSPLQQLQHRQLERGENAFSKSVETMEAQDALRGEVGHAQHKRKKASGKIGGFFSRLASFRFSLKKGAEEKAKIKKKHEPSGLNTLAPQQRVATKDDYIYIPLKGPTPNNNNNSQQQFNKPPSTFTPNGPSLASASKPPLPRVVHASVKKDQNGEQQHHQHHHRHRRRRTIDSACGGGGGGGVSNSMEPMGLIETDLDTEVTVITSGDLVKTTRSLLDLGHQDVESGAAAASSGNKFGARYHPEQQGSRHRPHKSMEFLLDKENLKVVEPPENELQKGERVMSEHQLRVQRSLQKLTVPEWYKQSQIPREGFLLKKNSPRETRWTGTGSKTTSLSSLGSNSHSPLVLSPTPFNQPFVRWSTSKLNSTASSPCASTRSSFNSRQPNGSISPSSVRSSFSYRQPYMGWRSQERLNRPRTPAERLASSLLASQAQNRTQQHQQQESPEIQTSIKEVTSAIVHYVSGLRPEDNQDSSSQRSNSVSPRGSQKLCWLESSFVGTKPLDSPQTPVTLSSSSEGHGTPVPPASLRLDLQPHNDVTLLTTSGSTLKPSPSSTTLEDVLDSLLGLPSTGRAPSPSLQGTVSANISPCHLGQDEDLPEQFRRRSDGSGPASASFNPSRRVSFNSSPVLRCRYSRCSKTALATSPEANHFKNCHNCSYTYCSRTCRRAHWDKHRKTCLFSRIGSLCRQVIAAAKEQKDTLAHLSTMARRGYLSHGTGAVKCFFPNPEAAEAFLSNGLGSLGELTYVRWQDLLPSEMGPQLYAELVKMCKNYNPDSKLVLYVSVCVVSETPASGAVKWERQLVSRCAKMRLSKEVRIPEREPLENPETLILTYTPITGDESKIKMQRQKAVGNLQSHLRSRGVSLKRQHPEIYTQLMQYCDDINAKFIPVTVYPKDSLTGKSFMCIIMLETDEDSLRKLENAGVKVRIVDLMKDPLIE